MSTARRQSRENENEALGDASRRIRETGEEVMERARESLEQVRDTASEYVEQGRAKAKHLTQEVERRVKDQPMTALLIAAGVGFVMGMIFRRS